MSNHHRRTRSAGRRLGSGLVNLLLLVATLAGVAYLVPSVLGYERYVITGGSMSGTFEKGSIAFEKQVPVEDLAVGDVITYQPPADSGVSTLVTHRIVDITHLKDGRVRYQTKGDANPDRDPWRFELEQTDQPVVQHTVPYAGWLFIKLADPHVRILAIGVPAGLVALASLVELARAVRTSRRPEPAVVEALPLPEPELARA